jgi:hypothetical protein
MLEIAESYEGLARRAAQHGELSLRDGPERPGLPTSGKG